jgi:hypothetical protein
LILLATIKNSKLWEFHLGICEITFFNASYSNVQSENNLLYQSEVLANGAVSIEN